MAKRTPTQCTLHSSELARLAKEVAIFRKVLFGNGEVGLCEDVREIRKMLGLPLKLLAAAVLALNGLTLILTLSKYFRR